MKWLPVIFVVIFAIVLAGASCVDSDDDEHDSPADDDDDDDNNNDDNDDFSPPFCEVDEAAISALLEEMTLEEKAAQMLVLGEQAFPFWIPAKTTNLVRDLGIGGVFLQTVNALFPGPATMSELVNELNETALSGKHAIPLLFSVDQEGGTTQAWQSLTGGTDGPGNMALGALDDPDATFDIYAMMGREARAFGANVAYSPEFDLVVDPAAAWLFTKAFGESAELTSRHAPSAVRGFQSELMLGAMKHFPGGGCVWEDTHAESPTCTLTKSELVETHLAPFIAAIEAGADMVMVSPVIFAGLDPELPAALSSQVKLDYLRGELGFDGLISTGDMGMPPFQHEWGMPKEVLAVKSGADLLLYVFEVATYQDAERIVGNIADAVRAGEIPADQFDESIARILRHKQKYCLFERPFTDPERAEALNATAENRQLATQTIADSITLVRNDEGLWPLEATDGNGLLVISPMRAMLADPASGFAMFAGTTLAEQVSAIAPLTQRTEFVPGSLPSLLDDAVLRAADPAVETVVIGTYNAHYEPAQSQMVRDVLALGKPTVILAFGTPFDLLSFPDASTFLAVYNFRDLAQELAAETLFGGHEPLGRLPVTLPGLHEAGHSAYYD
ncbi:MAG: glycoside hydrolase family 3 N-terminal domain-containing protein [Candidatus Lernaella stagnicola]|nr:glycoside hydrolase family 3 N-terminal domain-containing protein [Candidatus Lernaella stagnicola]